MPKARVAIIGAGVSGLAAAIHILDRAHDQVDLTIYEARREAGGRTRSFIDPETGDELDNGQHLLMGCYHATLEFCRMIGTYDELDFQRSLRVPFQLDDWAAELRLPPLPAPLNLLAGLMSTKLLSGPEKIAALSFGNFLRKAEPSRFRLMTCSDLFRKLRQPRGLIKKLWEPIALATLNTPINIASAEVFVNTLKLIFLGSRRDPSLVFPRVGLTRLLIQPAMEKLAAANASIRLGHSVGKVQHANGRFTVDGNSFDAVIVSSSGGADLQLPITLPKTSYSPILNAYFWLDRVVQTSPVQAYVGTTLQWSFAKSSHFAAQRLALTVSAADDVIQLPNGELTQMLWRELRRATGRDAVLLKAQIIKEKRATMLLDVATQNSRPKCETEFRGLFLAGDTVQNGLPATIEGAVRNGRSASRAAISHLRL